MNFCNGSVSDDFGVGLADVDVRNGCGGGFDSTKLGVVVR